MGNAYGSKQSDFEVGCKCKLSRIKWNIIYEQCETVSASAYENRWLTKHFLQQCPVSVLTLKRGIEAKILRIRICVLPKHVKIWAFWVLQPIQPGLSPHVYVFVLLQDAKFMDGKVPSVTVVTAMSEVKFVQQTIKRMCGWQRLVANWKSLLCYEKFIGHFPKSVS